MRAAVLVTAVLAVACSDPGPTTRSYRMGFSVIPPSQDTAIVIPALLNWAPHADAAIMHVSPPWAALISGIPADSAVAVVEMPLVNYYRSEGFDIVFVVDPTDGLNRAAEAPALIAAGRSVTDTAIQRLYREWVLQIALQVQPEYLGLVAETNLIRAIAPNSLYVALKTMANAVAGMLMASPIKLFVSVQVETAWGALGGGGTYVGIAQDLADFPFVEAVGLSSYPYLGGFLAPDSVPDNYYSRIVQGTTLPVLVVEGGWPSVSVGAVTSSPIVQARYIARQAELLDASRAEGWFQLTFYDLDTTGLAVPPGSALPLFTHLGLADSAMNAKPALATWDSVLARPYRP